MSRVGQSQKHLMASPVPSSSNNAVDKDMQDYEVSIPPTKIKHIPQPVPPSVPPRLEAAAGNGKCFSL